MESLANKHCRRKAGFSLVELMTVLVIVGLIMAFLVGNFSQITSSTLLTSSGDQLVNKIVQAQQSAIAESANIEVRFYQLSEGADSEVVDWSIALVRKLSDGTYEPVENPYRLPSGVAINSSSSLSTIVGVLPETEDLERTLIKDEDIDASYTSFRFNSDGSTNLPEDANGDTWHITMVNRGDALSTTAPRNFYTVRIDPYSGSVRSFRP